MKQYISLAQWQELSLEQQQFITTWKKRKYPTDTQLLSIGMCIELLVAITYNFHTEDSDGRFFSKILTNDESIIAWEGNELIDILFYEVVTSIKRRLASGTYNETTP